MSADHHRRVYLLVDDVYRLFVEWAKRNGFTLPSRGFFTALVGRVADAAGRAIDHAAEVQIIEAETFVNQVGRLIEEHAPTTSVICIDRTLAAAVTPEQRIPFEMTRLVEYRAGHWHKLEHPGPRPGHPDLDAQAVAIARRLGAGSAVTIVDDVLFDGGSLNACVEHLRAHDLRIHGAIVGMRKMGEPRVDVGFPIHQLLCYLAGRLYDAVDMRDFIFGCPEGGRVVSSGGNGHPSGRLRFEYAVPYLHGFGDTEGWASIARETAPAFTDHALEIAAELYTMIERLTGQPVHMQHIGRWPYDHTGRAITADINERIADVIERVRVQLRHSETASAPAHA